MNKEIEMETLPNKSNAYHPKARNISVPIRVCFIAILGLGSLAFGFGLTSTTMFLNLLNVALQQDKYGAYYEMLYGMSMHNIFLGGFLSTLFLSFVTRFSRKKLLIAAGFLTSMAYVIMYFVQDLMAIFISKLLVGFGAGIFCVTVPGMLYDISFEGYSGIVSGIHSVAICIGLVLGHGLTGLAKQYAFSIIGFPIMIFFIVSMFLFGLVKVKDTKSEGIEEKGILQLIKDKKCRKPMLIYTIYHIGQHVSGVDFFTMSTEKFFTNSDQYYAIVLTSMLIAIPVSLLSSILVNSVGRKPMMILSCFLLTLVTLLLGFSIYTEILMYCYVIAFNLGLATVPWIIINEMLLKEYGRAGMTLAVLTNWGSGYLVNIIALHLFAYLGQYIWFLFSALIFCVGVFATVFVPETRNYVVESVKAAKDLINSA